MYKKAEASFWTAKKIDLSADASDWKRLSSTERHFILHVLAFFACCLRRHCQQEPTQQLCHGNHVTGSLMLLRLLNCGRKYPQRDILASYRHVRQRSYKEAPPPTCNRNNTMRPVESTVGASMVQSRSGKLCRTLDLVRHSRRNFLFRLLLCYLPAKKAGSDAGAKFQ